MTGIQTGNVPDPQPQRAVHPPRRGWLWGILFALNLAVFSCACLVWVRLASGDWLVFQAASFRASVLAPVAEALSMPLSVVHDPWMIPVYALLASIFVFVPILIAANYRLAAAVVFVVVLAFFGHAVVLALGVMVGCMVIAFARHKGYGPMTSTALGLVSPISLLALLAYAGVDAAVVEPIQRWIPVSWLVLAGAGALLAGLATASVTWLAKIRRGIILPLQGGMLAAALFIFQTQVGIDRLDFALLQRQISSPESIFPSGSVEPWRSRAQSLNAERMNLGRAIRAQMRADIQRLSDRARGFLERHPRSPWVPETLWLLSQMHSLQLDEHALDNGQVSFSADWPAPQAAKFLETLASRHPAQPQAGLARLRLAELELRNRRPAQAKALLEEAAKTLAPHLEQAQPAPTGEDRLFLPPRPVPPLQLYAKGLERARYLLWLIEQNQVLQDESAAAVLAAYMNLNPYSRNFGRDLRRLIRAEGDDPERPDPGKTPLADNLELALALSFSDNVLRARRLVELAGGLTDAAIQANYELGRLQFQARQLQERVPGLKSARYYFNLVAHEAPPNPWQDVAGQHLKWLQRQQSPQEP